MNFTIESKVFLQTKRSKIEINKREILKNCHMN